MVIRKLLACIAATAALAILPGRPANAENVPLGKDGIKGVVTDIVTGEALIGAGILVDGTSEGTVTDLDGSYALPLREGSYSLTVSYIGYTSLTFNVVINADGTGTIQTPDETSIAVTEDGVMIYMAQ